MKSIKMTVSLFMNAVPTVQIDYKDPSGDKNGYWLIDGESLVTVCNKLTGEWRERGYEIDWVLQTKRPK